MILNNPDIKEIRGISDKRASMYHKLGIFTTEDLIGFYPRNYIDYSRPKKIKAYTLFRQSNGISHRGERRNGRNADNLLQ